MMIILEMLKPFSYDDFFTYMLRSMWLNHQPVTSGRRCIWGQSHMGSFPTVKKSICSLCCHKRRHRQRGVVCRIVLMTSMFSSISNLFTCALILLCLNAENYAYFSLILWLLAQHPMITSHHKINQHTPLQCHQVLTPKWAHIVRLLLWIFSSCGPWVFSNPLSQ
jgi:hypothetical protein